MVFPDNGERGKNISGSGKCLIIVPFVKKADKGGKEYSDNERPELSVISEAEGLAAAINLEILKVHLINLKTPVAGTFFGKGQIEVIRNSVEEYGPDVVIVNVGLSPIQQRNLENTWNVKVIDRTALILEIFGERAQTKEGKLQVELATCQYQKSRLVRTWTHLERQRGALGFIGGPGETQLEIDKRLIAERIDKLKKELEKVRKTRHMQSKRRKKQSIPVISLIGYTNAGKSSLFNVLVDADIFARDLLFATLDPTARQMTLAPNKYAVLTDTVGFISDLPTDLIAAFRATLEQIQEADIILHVRDMSSEDREAQSADVISILEDLGIHYQGDDRIIEVWNKIDAVEEKQRRSFVRQSRQKDVHKIVLTSASRGQGLDALREAILNKIEEKETSRTLVIKVEQGEPIAWLYNHGTVLDSETEETILRLKVSMSDENWLRFDKLYPGITRKTQKSDQWMYQACQTK